MKTYLHIMTFLSMALCLSSANSQTINLTPEELSVLLSGAVQQALQEQKIKEDKELEKLPDVLECDSMKWMSSCVAINNQAKKNPSAPVRVYSEDGVEWNFPPGTHKSIINLILSGTEESAEEFMVEYDKRIGHFFTAKDQYSEVAMKTGDLKSVRDYSEIYHESKKPLGFNPDGLKLSLFAESTCGACRKQIHHLVKFKENNPKMPIAVYLVDNNTDYLNALKEEGFQATILTEKQYAKAAQKGINSWPTIWIDNRKINERKVLNNVHTVRQLEKESLAISKREAKS